MQQRRIRVIVYSKWNQPVELAPLRWTPSGIRRVPLRRHEPAPERPRETALVNVLAALGGIVGGLLLAAVWVAWKG